ncbi:MAG: hypothetical protein HYY44_06930 [Deltaproteobacteria bacterium]|nr:hypothetical protein [Deltaproteobacteria bacterium]
MERLLKLVAEYNSPPTSVVCGRAPIPLVDQYLQLEEIWRNETYEKKLEALFALIDNSKQIRTQDLQLPLCQKLRDLFSPASPNEFNETHLGAYAALDCPQREELLLPLIFEQENPYLKIIATYHIAQLKNSDICRQVWDYFVNHSRQISTSLLEQLSFMAPTCGICESFQGIMNQADKYGVPVDGVTGFVKENWVRCLGRLSGQTDTLLSILKGHKDEAFEVQAQAITSLERLHRKGSLAQTTVCETVDAVLQSGHAQLKPEAMFLSKKINCSNANSLIFALASSAGPMEKYLQTAAILAFVEFGEFENALRVAEKSSYPDIQALSSDLNNAILKRSLTK